MGPERKTGVSPVISTVLPPGIAASSQRAGRAGQQVFPEELPGLADDAPGMAANGGCVTPCRQLSASAALASAAAPVYSTNVMWRVNG